VGFVYCIYTDADGEDYNYALYVPPNYTGREALPLLVFLHGRDERGRDGHKQVNIGLGAIIRRHLEEKGAPPFDFLVMFPHNESDMWAGPSSDSDLVIEEIDDVLSNYAVDVSRIYLTGHSSGGTGTWALAAKYPDRWAAIVPVGSSADPSIAAKIAQLPCWCFHGEADRVTSVKIARKMVDALRQQGGRPRYTEFLHLEHNIWGKVYAMPELYQWLAQQRRAQSPM